MTGETEARLKRQAAFGTALILLADFGWCNGGYPDHHSDQDGQLFSVSAWKGENNLQLKLLVGDDASCTVIEATIYPPVVPRRIVPSNEPSLAVFLEQGHLGY